MNGEMVLKQSEMGAVGGGSFEVRVTGRRKRREKKHSLASLGATGCVVLMVILMTVLLGAGNLMPAAISQRLLEETDVQYADGVESKKIVLQQALLEGEFPDDTAAILKENGYTVGYVGEDGNFVENNKAGRELALYHEGKVILAKDFVTAMSSDAKLYAAVKKATYDRAAAYYDETGGEVFEAVGTNRNNFSSEEDFAATMKRVMGSGNALDVNSAEMTEVTSTDAEGEQTTTYEPATNGEAARASTDAAEFIEQVRVKNPAETAGASAVKTGDALNAADAVSKEQRSSLFYALMMENISKMKMGEGNEAKVHDAMNFLTTSRETEVVDVKTGKTKKVSGSPLEAPSLAALLSGTKADKAKVENYSEERVLKTIRNQVGTKESSSESGVVMSVDNKVKGSIGTWIEDGSAVADGEVLQSVEPSIRGSLVENGYEGISGIDAGELLAEGAVNLGRKMAQASGATAGDGEAVAAYARVQNSVLAMEARVERETRSPFDITSKNTFLGSIMYKLAMIQVKEPEVRNMGSLFGRASRVFSEIISKSVNGLLPTSLAAEENEGFMTDFGDCEVSGRVGAVATAGCAQIATFDASTLKDIYNNSGFVKFVEENTELSSSGARRVIPGSVLGNFIAYSVGRNTPIGVVDGGILEAIQNENGKISFVPNILEMITAWLGASDEELSMASGEMYVNSAGNADWQEIKYAQRYVALARAAAMLKEHSTDATAYRKVRFFEGEESPVVAYLREYRVNSGSFAGDVISQR